MDLQLLDAFPFGIEEIAKDIADRALAGVHQLFTFADIAGAQYRRVTALVHRANADHRHVSGGGGEDHVPHAGFAL